jgi:flagellar basal-body rod modification protein FlgD
MQVYGSTMSGGIVSNDAGKDTVSKDGFLKILAAELQNQDPMNAQDNTQYVAQMAQFTALEQMQNLNASMEEMNTSIGNLMTSEKFQQGSLMLGKTAVISLGDDKYINAEVTGVKIADGEVKITAGDKDYSLDDVVGLEMKPEADATATEQNPSDGGSAQDGVQNN